MIGSNARFQNFVHRSPTRGEDLYSEIGDLFVSEMREIVLLLYFNSTSVCTLDSDECNFFEKTKRCFVQLKHA